MSESGYIAKIFMDKKGKIVLGQKPNAPIITWLVATLIKSIAGGQLYQAARVIAFGALFTWAWLELFQGVNYFRRTLGLIVLIIITYSFASVLA